MRRALRLLGRGRLRLSWRWVAALALAAVAGTVDAFWIEPQLLLEREDVDLGLAGPPWTVVHLSDLHIARETPHLRRLLRETAAARPDAVLISGDFLRDLPAAGPLGRHTAAAAAFLRELRAIAPVYGVQGHSEHQGPVIAAFQAAGVTWLSNEGVRAGPGGAYLLLGLNQQVGSDPLVQNPPNPFGPVRWPADGPGEPLWGARRGFPYRNFYSLYDPARGAGVGALTDDSGPLAWSGYELTCEVRIDDIGTAAGFTVHSRYPLGEDRMIRLIRERPEEGRPRGFFLTAQGTGLAGRLLTGADARTGRWTRVRLRTEVTPQAVRVRARVWPAGEPEPRAWQASAEDRSPTRIPAGTAGLWFAGGGAAQYRNLRVTAPDGRLLLDRPLAGRARPAGFHEGARATRLELALARSPEVPPGTPRLLLTHVPDPVLQASRLGLDAVLAGHTHGGQVRLPFVGPLTTRSRLGNFYDRGPFHFAAPNRRGWTTLYVNPGTGTSLLPIRFFCPPRFAVVRVGGG